MKTILGKLRVQIRGGTVKEETLGLRAVVDHEKPRIVIGRGESCHVRLANDRGVSAAHCELVATDKGVKVRDLTSTNGTWVDDVLLGPDQYAFLRRACTLRVGNSHLTFTPKREGSEQTVAGKFGLLQSRSTKMGQVFERLGRIASLSSPVHITGETGTGKSYLARIIHDQSKRAQHPFVVIDCSSIPPTLVESELFGHTKGAFTGATQAKTSPFVEANGGTVFLDEIGDLSLDNQSRLLRVVDAQEVKPVGQNHYQKINVRIVSATVHDLAARVNAGLFREDLYARLTAVRVELPPLRERRDDIEPLIRQILGAFERTELFDDISPTTLAWLRERPWTGNVRQLRNVVVSAVELAAHGRLDMELAYSLGPAEAGLEESASDRLLLAALTRKGASYEAVLDAAGRLLVEHLHRETDGNISEIARRAEMSRDYARDLLAKHGIRKIPPRNKERK